jgi:hypothetical protein
MESRAPARRADSAGTGGGRALLLDGGAGSSTANTLKSGGRDFPSGNGGIDFGRALGSGGIDFGRTESRGIGGGIDFGRVLSSGRTGEGCA